MWSAMQGFYDLKENAKKCHCEFTMKRRHLEVYEEVFPHSEGYDGGGVTVLRCQVIKQLFVWVKWQGESYKEVRTGSARGF